jgi:hypothetical protein
MTLSPRVLMCLAVVARRGSRGATADEAAYQLDEHPLSVRPVISRLKTAGLICDSGKRRPSDLGNPSAVWVIPKFRLNPMERA